MYYSALLDVLKLLPVLGVLVILVITLGVNHAWAAGIIYDSNEVVVRNNPTVCSISPLDSDLTKKQIEKFATQSRVSVSEWQQHLQSEVVKKEWPNWEIHYRQLHYDEIDSDAILDCDVALIFSKTSTNLDLWGTLGLAMSDYETGKTIIEIYYLTPDLCDSGERVKDPQASIIWLIQEPCYGDMMVSSQLGSVIRHELGHALGLGHYKSANEDETLNWKKGQAAAPSIMVEISYEDTKQHKITPRDIEKLQAIYGTDGFFLNSKEEKKLTLVPPYLEDQKYTDFENNEYGFELKYPSGWFVDDNLIDFKDYSRILFITKEPNNLNKTISLTLSENSTINGNSSDENILDAFVEKEKKFCANRTIKDNDFLCENFVLLDSKIEKYANNKIYKINYVWNDGASYHVTHINHLIVEDEIWRITGEGILAPFLLSKNTVIDSINSFQLANSGSLQDYRSSKGFEPAPNTSIDPPEVNLDMGSGKLIQIPDWVRGNAEWWAQGAIGDSDFVSGIQYLIEEGIMTIPETAQEVTGGDSREIPSWIKNNADWWAQELISDDDFVKGIRYLIGQGIISV